MEARSLHYNLIEKELSILKQKYKLVRSELGNDEPEEFDKENMQQNSSSYSMGNETPSQPKKMKDRNEKIEENSMGKNKYKKKSTESKDAFKYEYDSIPNPILTYANGFKRHSDSEENDLGEDNLHKKVRVNE